MLVDPVQPGPLPRLGGAESETTAGLVCRRGHLTGCSVWAPHSSTSPAGYPGASAHTGKPPGHNTHLTSSSFWVSPGTEPLSGGGRTYWLREDWCAPRVSSLCPGTHVPTRTETTTRIPPADLKTPPGGKGSRQEAALQVGVGVHLWGADQELSPPLLCTHHYCHLTSAVGESRPGKAGT